MSRIEETNPLPFLIILLTLTILLPPRASAYDQYSQNKDATNCRACHGDFRSSNYISPVDGQDWGDLHNLHRNTMLNGDCSTCHQSGGRFPVALNSSSGGEGLDPIACTGCHGREEDNTPANPDFGNSDGRGAGLRQHHYNSGVTTCTGCHQDADPANYTPVGEEVLPPYYANPGVNHPAIPTDSCNDDGSEHFAGLTIGLDNDGDTLYDSDDPGCSVSGAPNQSARAGVLLQNHPNPFNPSTEIRYVTREAGHVLLQVFSVNGGLVRTLVNAHHGRGGTYQVTWNGRAEDGRLSPSGVYFYRLESSGDAEMKKMILLK